MTYAKHTSVPVNQTKGEIEAVLGKYGARKFGMTIEPGRAVVIFEAHSRTVRFVLPLPEGPGDKVAQQQRQRWRALLLCIKAKLESVESKIETFDEAFLAHVMTSEGKSVYEEVMPTLLPAPSKITAIR